VTKPPLNPAAAADLARRISFLLDDMTVTHQRLLIETQAHREAIRKADGHGVEASASRQAALLARVGELEGKRRELVGMHPIPGRPTLSVTLTDLIGLTPADQRPRLQQTAEELRALMRAVHAEQQTVAAATRSLLAHMEGLMRQVGRTLSHAQTYGRNGVVEPGPAVISALDLAC
jgi:hypothetical protein